MEEIVKEDMSKVGIDVKMKGEEERRIYDRKRDGSLDMILKKKWGEK